jgi:hypothetical protein
MKRGAGVVTENPIDVVLKREDAPAAEREEAVS